MPLEQNKHNVERGVSRSIPGTGCNAGPTGPHRDAGLAIAVHAALRTPGLIRARVSSGNNHQRHERSSGPVEVFLGRDVGSRQ